MTTLRGLLEANAAALAAARSRPRDGVVEMEIGRLEQERDRLVNRALSSRNQEAISWLAVHGEPIKAHHG